MRVVKLEEGTEASTETKQFMEEMGTFIREKFKDWKDQGIEEEIRYAMIGNALIAYASFSWGYGYGVNKEAFLQVCGNIFSDIMRQLGQHEKVNQ